MDRVRDGCSVGLSLREHQKLRTRLPLPKVTLAGADARQMEPFVHLLQDELNIKAVDFADDLEQYGTFRLQVDAKALGPKLGKQMKGVLAATRSGDWTLDGDRAVAGGVTLEPGEFVLQLQPKDGITAAALSSNDVDPTLKSPKKRRSSTLTISLSNRSILTSTSRITCTVRLPTAIIPTRRT